MTMLGRGKRQAEEKAKKAEKARKRATEAARRAKEAEAEAAAALREAEEAEAAESKAEAAESKAEAAEAEAEETAEADADGDEPAETEGEATTKTKGKRKPKPAKGEPDADEEPAATEDAATEDAEATEDEDETVHSKVITRTDKAGKTEKVEDDADEDQQDDDGDDDEPAARKGRWLPRFGPKSYALIVVNLVLLGVLGWLLVTVQGQKAEERAVQQVSFAAKQAAEDLSSYDYKTIDADLKRATERTTGKFRGDFTAMTGRVKPSATQQQAVVQGTAVRTAVESVDGSKAIALVYLNQESAKGADGQRTPSQYTLRLVMTKVGDRWLVSELQMM